MKPIYFDTDQAAEYVGLTRQQLKSALHYGTGPAFLRPSPRKALFTADDLDLWQASWQRIEQPKRA